MTSTPDADVDAAVHTRIRRYEVVAELGQQALETDDLDQFMHDASVAVAETLGNECAKVLELLPGGDIRVDSEPGEGATFSFPLPAADSR